MVIKTDLCTFSEYRMFPGRGQKFCAKDGKVHVFLFSKCAKLFQQRKKPVKLHWTQNWRKMNKKGKTEEHAKKKTRRAVKVRSSLSCS